MLKKGGKPNSRLGYKFEFLIGLARQVCIPCIDMDYVAI